MCQCGYAAPLHEVVTSHDMKLLEAAKQVGPEMCGATTALCGMALMSVRLDLAGVILMCLGPHGLIRQQLWSTCMYSSEAVSQAFKPSTWRVVGEPPQYVCGA